MSASACVVQPPSPSSHFEDGEFGEAMPDDSMDMDEADQHDGSTTTIIFDWDDTLLPSSWLAAKGLRLDFPATLPHDVVAELAEHEVSVCALLTKAMAHGTVVIITNAETGWVELSAQRFLPTVVPVLEKLTVVSARSTFEPSFPDNPYQWKVGAFKQQVTSSLAMTRSDLQKAVISFGDSVHERDALHKVVGGMQNTFTKSVKFVERPSLEQLRREVELVHSCMDYICSCRSHLDLMLTIQLLYN